MYGAAAVSIAVVGFVIYKFVTISRWYWPYG